MIERLLFLAKKRYRPFLISSREKLSGEKETMLSQNVYILLDCVYPSSPLSIQVTSISILWSLQYEENDENSG
jgi:hypothetical protein